MDFHRPFVYLLVKVSLLLILQENGPRLGNIHIPDIFIFQGNILKHWFFYSKVYLVRSKLLIRNKEKFSGGILTTRICSRLSTNCWKRKTTTPILLPFSGSAPSLIWLWKTKKVPPSSPSTTCCWKTRLPTTVRIRRARQLRAPLLKETIQCCSLTKNSLTTQRS